MKLKRTYEPPSPGDGYRVLVDRLWPRGLVRQDARIDRWLKEIAPSPALRTWFGHDPEKWADFRRRYFTELAANPAVGELREILQTRRTVTLVYAARDKDHNHAVALKMFMERASARS